ncbi:DNA-binding response regulator [Eubacterium sp. An11]|uniref:response regulator transcription factor n=1 Tax=Eubacterium sp. An11 TaxID=1965542 RepID=UPI000B37ADE2|nr:response regulator transcription factor [Eubacterium sp. An11]OUQ67020.1 DNA-binding response regulator [Eubacterium sp. An11]
MRLLVVEDEKDLNSIIVKNLEAEGYIVDSCYDGEDAVIYMTTIDYDAVILDVMIPKMSGFEVLKKVREMKIETPVLFLTARDHVDDIVFGLNIGADDYMVKPFSFDELMARLRVIVRRKPEVRENIYTCGDLILNVNTRQVTRQGREISLSPKEYAILECLIRNKNIVLTRAQIESNIWDMDYSGESNVIDVYIRYLRKKIDDDFDEKLIQTVRGVGYMLKCNE